MFWVVWELSIRNNLTSYMLQIITFSLVEKKKKEERNHEHV